MEKRFVNASSVDAVVVNVDSSNFLRSPAETCNHRPSKRADGLGVGLGSALSVLQKGWWSSVSWYSVAAHVCSCALSVASTRARGREGEKARRRGCFEMCQEVGGNNTPGSRQSPR